MITGDLLKFAGVRRRAILVGDGREPRASPPHARREPRRDRLRVRRRALDLAGQRGPASARAALGDRRPCSRRTRGRRADRHRLGLQRPRAGRDRRAGAPARGEGAGRPAGDRAPDRAPRRVRARAGRAAVRAAPAGLRRRGLAREARVRPRRQRVRRDRRPAALGVDRARDQARLARAGLLPRQPNRPERERVRDDQVPHDARRRRGAAGGARAPTTRPRARSSRSRTIRASRASAASCAASRSTRSRRC